MLIDLPGQSSSGPSINNETADSRGMLSRRDFCVSLRKFAAPAALIGGFMPSLGLGEDGSSVASERKEAAKKLSEIKEDLRISSKTLKVLKWVTKLAGKRGSIDELEKFSNVLGKLEKATKTLEKTTGRVSELVEDEKYEEATALKNDLKTKVKLILDPESYLRSARVTIRKIEVGIVAETSNKEFEVSFDQYTRDPAKALRRIGKMGDAMEENISVLECQQNKLEHAAERTQKIAQAHCRLAIVLMEIGSDFPSLVGESIFLKGIDSEFLAQHLSDTGSTAKAKLYEVDNALRVERRRLRNLDTNLKTFWSISRGELR